jgi:hypothetical protein
MITVKFEELDYSQFDRRQVRSAMGRAARALTNVLKGQVKGGGAGETYRRNGREHTASAPGQPPARYTGTLLRSMKGRASRRGYALVVAAVAPHAALLELGSRHTEPRPYFAPTFTDRDLVVGLLRTAYARAVTTVPGQVGRPPKTVEIN